MCLDFNKIKIHQRIIWDYEVLYFSLIFIKDQTISFSKGPAKIACNLLSSFLFFPDPFPIQKKNEAQE